MPTVNVISVPYGVPLIMVQVAMEYGMAEDLMDDFEAQGFDVIGVSHTHKDSVNVRRDFLLYARPVEAV